MTGALSSLQDLKTSAGMTGAIKSSSSLSLVGGHSQRGIPHACMDANSMCAARLNSNCPYELCARARLCACTPRGAHAAMIVFWERQHITQTLGSFGWRSRVSQARLAAW